MEPGACDVHCDGVCGVKAEEPDAGLAAIGNVGADVKFGERGEHGERRRCAKTDSGHSKRDDANPRLALKSVDFKWCGDYRSQEGGIDRPMGKEQVVPRLRHDPWAAGERPKSREETPAEAHVLDTALGTTIRSKY